MFLIEFNTHVAYDPVSPFSQYWSKKKENVCSYGDGWANSHSRLTPNWSQPHYPTGERMNGQISSPSGTLVVYCSVAKLYPTLCDPMDCSMPGFPVLHHLLELAETHVHRVDDAIQPSHPPSSPSPPAFNLSQHLGLFQ